MDQTQPKSPNYIESRRNDFGRSYDWGFGQSRKDDKYDHDWLNDDKSKRNFSDLDSEEIGKSRGIAQSLGQTRRDNLDLGFNIYESRKADTYYDGSIKEDYESTKGDQSLRPYGTDYWRKSQLAKESTNSKTFLSQTENGGREFSKSKRGESSGAYLGKTFHDTRTHESSTERQHGYTQDWGKSRQENGVSNYKSEEIVSTRGIGQSSKQNVEHRNYGESRADFRSNGPLTLQNKFGQSRLQVGEIGRERRSLQSLPKRKYWLYMAPYETFKRDYFDARDFYTPRISIRANIKDYGNSFTDDSLNTSSTSAYSVRRWSCSRYVLITCITLICAAIAGAITLAIVLSTLTGDPPKDKTKYFEVSMTCTVQEEFIVEYSNINSAEFRTFSSNFCNAVKEYSNNVKYSDGSQCIVDEIRNGSCIVSVRLLYILSATITTTDITNDLQIIFNTSSSTLNVGVFVFIQVTFIQVEVRESVVTNPVPPTQTTQVVTTQSTTPIATTGTTTKSNSPIATTGTTRQSTSPITTTGTTSQSYSSTATTGTTSQSNSPIATTGTTTHSTSSIATTGTTIESTTIQATVFENDTEEMNTTNLTTAASTITMDTAVTFSSENEPNTTSTTKSNISSTTPLSTDTDSSTTSTTSSTISSTAKTTTETDSSTTSTMLTTTYSTKPTSADTYSATTSTTLSAISSTMASTISSKTTISKETDTNASSTKPSTVSSTTPINKENQTSSASTMPTNTSSSTSSSTKTKTTMPTTTSSTMPTNKETETSTSSTIQTTISSSTSRSTETDTSTASTMPTTISSSKSRSTESDTSTASTMPTTISKSTSSSTETDTSTASTMPTTISRSTSRSTETDTSTASTLPTTISSSISSSTETNTSTTSTMSTTTFSTLPTNKETDTSTASSMQTTISSSTPKSTETDTSIVSSVPTIMSSETPTGEDTSASSVSTIPTNISSTETDTSTVSTMPTTVSSTPPTTTGAQCNSSKVENGAMNVRTVCTLKGDSFFRINISKTSEGNSGRQTIVSFDEKTEQYYGTDAYSVEKNFAGTPRTFSLVIPLVNCSYQGTYTVEVFLDSNETSVIPEQFDVNILDKPDEPILDISISSLENSPDIIHTCKGYVGNPRGTLRIEIKRNDSSNFQEYPDLLVPGKETVTKVHCGEHVEYKFGLNLPSSFNLSTVRCQAKNEFSISSGDEILSNSEVIALIPDGYCDDISSGYKHHPLGCGYYVWCVHEQSYAYAANENLCFDFSTNMLVYCTSIPECSGLHEVQETTII